MEPQSTRTAQRRSSACGIAASMSPPFQVAPQVQVEASLALRARKIRKIDAMCPWRRSHVLMCFFCVFRFDSFSFPLISSIFLLFVPLDFVPLARPSHFFSIENIIICPAYDADLDPLLRNSSESNPWLMTLKQWGSKHSVNRVCYAYLSCLG